jgi:hypothetical protein
VNSAAVAKTRLRGTTLRLRPNETFSSHGPLPLLARCPTLKLLFPLQGLYKVFRIRYVKFKDYIISVALREKHDLNTRRISKPNTDMTVFNVSRHCRISVLTNHPDAYCHLWQTLLPCNLLSRCSG